MRGHKGMWINVEQVSDCLAHPTVACMTSPDVLKAYAAIVLIFVLLAAPFGWRGAVRNGHAARHTFRKLVLSAVDILLTCAVVIAAYQYLRPDALVGAERVPAWHVLWQATAYALAIGGLVAGVTTGFGLGRLFARLTGAAVRLGRRGVVIAIDGPAASGKGTLAKRIAAHYRVPCLDTGLLYRAVARDVLRAGQDLADTAAAVACAKALEPSTFEDPALRGAAAGDAASVVARIPEVRAELLEYQRSFAKSPKGAVLDGRDIGTVVCPDAQVKIYVTASADERARRRHKELGARGENAVFEDVLEDIIRRDARDTGRAVAPLWPAKDAIQLDTTHLNVEEAFKAALAIIERRLAGASPPVNG